MPTVHCTTHRHTQHMSPTFPPYSDLTSLYLSPLFASGSLHSADSSHQPHPPADLPSPSAPPAPPQPTPGPSHKRRRSRSVADDDDDRDESPGPPPPPGATEQEQIQWKRRQNTLAARKSRKRKQEHVAHLESAVARLTAERETWRARALTYQDVLRENGIRVPNFA